MLARIESLQEIEQETAACLIGMSARDQMRIAILASKKNQAVVGENRNDEAGDFFEGRLIIERGGQFLSGPREQIVGNLAPLGGARLLRRRGAPGERSLRLRTSRFPHRSFQVVEMPTESP